MAHVDHTEAYKDLRDRVLDGIQQTFPIKGTLQTVELHGLEVKEGDLHADDIKDQHKSKVQGKTWASTVYGDVSLRDNKTGKVISRRRMRLAEVPRVTRRRSYIIDGTEYQVDNQWQLKPGIYAKRRVSGELEAAFNVPNRRSFDITFNPESKQFLMQRGVSSKAIPVYPLLKTMGVDDDSLERSWGKEILAANKNAKGVSTGLEKFFRADKRRAPKSKEEAESYLLETMNDSRLRPDATKATLGKAYSNVTGDSIKQATAKLLGIQAGAPEDDRDSLIYKDLRTTGDFAYDKITSKDAQRSIRNKVVRKMFSAKDVRDLVKFDMFNEPIRQTFYSNAAARPASQVNPVEMLAGAQQTTVMGPGGVQSQNAIDNMVGLKFVNPSHMGYLDPVRTPESAKSGVILRLPMGLTKKGKEPVIPMYNLKTGKVETVGPNKFNQSVVVLPDQVEWKDGKPKPKGTKVKASVKGNEPGEVSMKEADYVLRHPSQLFSLTTNLIPFLGNNSGNRATYAGQHLEQAISLQNREAPLVQVGTGSKQEGLETFENIVGRQASHQAPVEGTVTEVREDAVVIKGKDGTREVQLYNNFPLNDPKAVLHSTASVKPGQRVKAGQNVADTNFTRKGTLALGTNLRVAYIPYKGYNFEDGVVISESAAKKMTSEHMHKPELALDKNIVTDTNKFLIQNPDSFSKEQYNKLDKNGVVRVGQKVNPGDPLMLGMRPFQAKDRMSLQAIGRALSGRHTDVSLRWQSDHPGEVVAIHKDKDKVVVHVRTQEPMQVGDKLTGRHGNKGIVTKIIPDKQMPHTPDGKHIEAALNPSGVPGRMNVGQVLETAASKISEKTGKPYVVESFGGEDQLAKVKKDLKAAGLTDQEELFDPTTGMKMGKALVGPQHMLKLMHQIDKKHSARSGMGLPGGEEDPEAYDANLLPAQGGKSGGQSVGHLDLYTLLAHGAKANIREMQTYKSEGPDPQPDPAKRWPSQHSDVWSAIQLGEPLPPPKSTFSFRKFTDMLKASGINVEKKGHHFHLLPLTDKQVLEMSSGEVTKPGEVVYPNLDAKTGEPRPKAGGIFDERATGGHGGKKWSHISLAEPLPNPVFENAIQRVTGLSKKDYFSVVQGKKGLSKTGKIVDIDVAGASTGGPAIVNLLDKIDVKKELKVAEKELAGTSIPTGYAHRSSTPKIDKLVKKVKYLRALEQANMKASDAYAVKNLPVLPPAMRPISTLKDGSVKWGDLNELYKNLGTINTAMKDPSQQKLGDDQKQELRESLYDGVRALTGVGTYKDQTHKGIIHKIVGNPTKEGYFQRTLMTRRQDMSMRSTIVPEPAMGLDEVGLPKSRALTLYKPFVVRKLVEMGAAPLALDARKLIQNNDPMVYKALERVVEERPVLLKRDPALHRHSIQAFKPRLVAGKAIQIHPLVTSGYNADFDGDSCDLDTPLLLRIRGEVTVMTGRELEALLQPGEGNYIQEVQGIETAVRGTWAPVKTVSFHEVRDKKRYRVTTKNGAAFVVSEDHSLMVGGREVKPGQLELGVRLDTTEVRAEVGGSYDLGVILGHYMGDGSADERRVSIACKPREEKEYLIRLWTQQMGHHVSRCENNEYFQIYNREVAARVLEVAGRYCEGKFVGPSLLSGGRDTLSGLLSGYILADGSVEVTRSGSYLVRTWSRSKKLRDGMYAVACLLGVPCSARERVGQDGKRNYIISFGKEAIKLLDYRCPGKKGKLIARARQDYTESRRDNRVSQSARGYEVSAIELVDDDERMLDLEVDHEEHVFCLASGVLLHNTMSAYVPISDEAVEEARSMMPSANLYSEASGRVVYSPTLESALGIYKLGRVGKDTGKTFNNAADVLKQVNDGKLDISDVVKLRGMKTTAGKILLASALPEPMQKKMLTAHKPIDKKGLENLLRDLAEQHKGEYGETTNKLKDLGNGASSGAVPILSGLKGPDAIKQKEDPKSMRYVSVPVHSLSLDDFEPDRETRDRAFREAERSVNAINRMNLPKREKERRAVEVWIKASNKMDREHMSKMEAKPTNLALMLKAGVKPSATQYKQMVLSPVLMSDAAGNPINQPIKKSYSEGLDLASYWTQQQGARRGTVMKVQEVQDPGTFTKRMIQNTMDLVVSGDDCGTTRGVAMGIGDANVHDRRLAADVKLKGATFEAGTLLTPQIVDRIKAADKGATVVVRSPLKCEHAKGLCKKCAGLRPSGQEYDPGTNVGAIASQALGERSMQLTMKAFHSGGVVQSAGASRAVNDFERVQQLTDLTENIPNAATVAMKSGTIEKIDKDRTGVNVWVNGVRHHVGRDRTGASLHESLPHASKLEGYKSWRPPKVGMRVRAGEVLSDPNRTNINPRDLYRATNDMETVQNFLVDELSGIYGNDVRRQHVETVVRAMGNLTKVRDPGDAENILRGEFQSAAGIRALNKKLVKAGKRPVEHSPVLKGVDNMPLAVQEDWLAKMQHIKLKSTLLDAASVAARSNIHGPHPVPGIAFGAEFGLTSKDALKPGLKHLEDVPQYAY